MESYILIVFRVPEESVNLLGFRYVAELRPAVEHDNRKRSPIWRKSLGLFALSQELNFLDPKVWPELEEAITRVGVYERKLEVPQTVQPPFPTI
jgi:hypothetical protein